MSITEIYRLNEAVLSIYSENAGQHRTPVMVPAGAVVTVTDGPLDRSRMANVLWDGKTVMMFAVDLRDRGTLVRAAQR